MIRAVTNIGRIKCTRLELVLEIINTIHSRWTKFPSIGRPAWAKSQQRFENQVPTYTDVKPRGSRAITLYISANQGLDRKETLPAPNPNPLGGGVFLFSTLKMIAKKQKSKPLLHRDCAEKKASNWKQYL